MDSQPDRKCRAGKGDRGRTVVRLNQKHYFDMDRIMWLAGT